METGLATLGRPAVAARAHRLHKRALRLRQQRVQLALDDRLREHRRTAGEDGGQPKPAGHERYSTRPGPEKKGPRFPGARVASERWN